MKAIKFAKRIENLGVSGIRKMFHLACEMKDPIDLSIGQLHFDVPEAMKRAAQEAIASGSARYTVTAGIQALRERILTDTTSRLGYRPEAAMCTAGVSGGLALAIMCLVEEGDDVLMPDPYFVLYKSLTRLVGGRPVFYDTYPSFRITREALRSGITPQTRILIVNSPSNPTGVVMSREEIELVAEFAGEHELLVISDEIYDRLTYDEPEIVESSGPRCIGAIYPNTLLLNGFSKTFAMPGWRLGYACGPFEIIDRMCILQQYTFVCPNSIAQQAVLDAFDLDISDYVAEYRNRRDHVYAALRDHYSLVKPGGAFYVFPRCPWGTAQEFAEAALRRNLLIVPGSAVSERSTHFRISYSAPREKLEEGLRILIDLSREPEFA